MSARQPLALISPVPPDPDPTRSRDPGLPLRIGKYAVIARLGEGATSEVYLADDDFHQRRVAIKRVRSATPGDSIENHYRERFFAAEAALVGKLQHPNVVKIIDAVDDPEQPYLVMEYVPGDTLRRFCQPDALLPLDQIVEIGFKCAMALAYVARQGLIHRDVKPANILATLTNDMVTDIKITDFGSVFDHRSDRTQVFRVGSLPICRPSNWTAPRSTPAPTCTRWPPCCSTWWRAVRRLMRPTRWR